MPDDDGSVIPRALKIRRSSNKEADTEARILDFGHLACAALKRKFYTGGAPVPIPHTFDCVFLFFFFFFF